MVRSPPPPAADASASATVRLPEVTITADSESVEEGSPVAFTLTASPPPASDLTVNVSWSGGDSFLTETPPATVTIPVSGTFSLTAETDDDSVDEANDSVKVAIGAGSGYTVGSSDSATVEVTDNDTTTASPGPSTPGPSTPAPSGPLSAVSIAAAGTHDVERGRIHIVHGDRNSGAHVHLDGQLSIIDPQSLQADPSHRLWTSPRPVRPPFR